MNPENYYAGKEKEYTFHDIFDLNEIQKLQDIFSEANEVGSIITTPDGTPITKTSNCTRFCFEIRSTELGRCNCFKSDAEICRNNSDGPTIHKCLSGGLWDAGVSITVGNKHIGNWLIGQVKNEEINEEEVLKYADEIGVNRNDFSDAFNEVPVMSVDRFNKIAGMLFAFVNVITDKAYTNLQLKEKEERFHKLTKHLPSGINIFRPVKNGNDFEFVDLNTASEIALTKQRQELIGTLLEVFPNVVKTTLYSALKKVNTTGEDEFIPSCRNDDLRRAGWRESNIYKLESGEIVAIFRDTTAIIEAEQNLKKQNTELKRAKLKAEQNEIRFKSLHDASFGGIAIHIKGRILDCNQGLSNMTGYRHDELIGMDGMLLIAKRSREQVMKNIIAEYEKPYEVYGLRKNSDEFPLRIEGRMIPYKGKKVRVAEFRDITEIKKVEHELIVAKEKAEESDRLKSAFLANMSHEIRTPMNGILGFTSLLKEPGLSGEEQHNYIDIIQKSGDRMLNTVNDIIEISKIETGQASLLLKEVNISEKLEDLYHFFKPEAEKKEMQLFLQNEVQEEEALIKTDELKFTSILTNLIKNAIKYSNTGSITVRCKIKNNQLEISVKDTGIGIPENRLKAVFERFVQADIDDRHVYEGSGLGLAITKSYVEMLGGNIRVESIEGEGSTFFFTIEYNSVMPAGGKVEVPIIEIEPNMLKDVIILVAEDDNISYRLLESILSNKSCKLIRARNGSEVVDTFKSTPEIDLIMMDIRMPGMDGIEATFMVREFNKSIPIIAQTAYALEGDNEKALAAGCNEYITKPIVKTKLIEIVKQYLVL